MESDSYVALSSTAPWLTVPQCWENCGSLTAQQHLYSFSHLKGIKLKCVFKNFSICWHSSIRFNSSSCRTVANSRDSSQLVGFRTWRLSIVARSDVIYVFVLTHSSISAKKKFCVQPVRNLQNFIQFRHLLNQISVCIISDDSSDERTTLFACDIVFLSLG